MVVRTISHYLLVMYMVTRFILKMFGLKTNSVGTTIVDQRFVISLRETSYKDLV